MCIYILEFTNTIVKQIKFSIMKKENLCSLGNERNDSFEQLNFSELEHIIGGNKKPEDKDQGKALGINCCNDDGSDN